MKLENIKKGLITTIFGIIFLIADLVYIFIPMFIEKEIDISSTVILTIGTIGIGLLLSPDDLYGILKSKINK